MSNYRQILKQYWGYDDFRGIQREIIESIGSGHDTMGLMPTGGGKSITFQVPALAMEGVCIVVTPLIALMKDQVHHLHQLGIRAEAIYSGQQHEEILRILENCVFGGVKLLYVSPERLSSQLFQTKLRHMNVSFITVDEAHCISQWGYDFRPSYLEIANIRTLHPHAPVLALTATATPAVVSDICDKLSSPKDDSSKSILQTSNIKPQTSARPKDACYQRDARKFNVFRMSFERKNLAYLVSHSNDKLNELIHLFEIYEGSAIIYVRSRRHSREIAEHLTDAGFSATFYHAGLDHAQKDERQRDWQHDRIRIMVATNAFGMGIDKPDVRLVVHYECPDSIEAYFQEAGRAGRDGKPARAILLYNNSDHAKLEKRIVDTFPDKDYIRKVYEHLAYYYQIATGDGYGVAREFNIEEFCRRFHHFPIQVHSALQLLQRAGYLEYDEEADNQARVRFLVGREDLYRLEQVSPDEERVIISLLRNYGGLFADYGYIDESIVAQQAGLTQPKTYDVLKALSQRHLLHFIPRRNVPYIRYIQRREDAEHIQLHRDVYESSAKNDDSLRQQILNILADDKPHHITELARLPYPSQDINATLTLLIREEYVFQQDGYLQRATT